MLLYILVSYQVQSQDLEDAQCNVHAHTDHLDTILKRQCNELLLYCTLQLLTNSHFQLKPIYGWQCQAEFRISLLFKLNTHVPVLKMDIINLLRLAPRKQEKRLLKTIYLRLPSHSKHSSTPSCSCMFWCDNHTHLAWVIQYFSSEIKHGRGNVTHKENYNLDTII